MQMSTCSKLPTGYSAPCPLNSPIGEDLGTKRGKMFAEAVQGRFADMPSPGSSAPSREPAAATRELLPQSAQYRAEITTLKFDTQDIGVVLVQG